MDINPDYLKIDGEIIRHLHQSETNRKPSWAITVLSREFGMEIVAEFVENQAIQDYLFRLRHRVFTGLLFLQTDGL